MTTASEQWRPIPDYEGFYEVSDLGRVRSVDRDVRLLNGQIRHYNGRIRKIKLAAQTGYPSVSLCTPALGEKLLHVHRLVMAAFVGPLPDGLQTRHLNGDKTDCRLGNLKYGTKSENQLDRIRHGRHNHAFKTSCKHGHAFDSWNTLRFKSNPRSRHCRTCLVEGTRARRAAKREREQIA